MAAAPARPPDDPGRPASKRAGSPDCCWFARPHRFRELLASRSGAAAQTAAFVFLWLSDALEHPLVNKSAYECCGDLWPWERTELPESVAKFLYGHALPELSPEILPSEGDEVSLSPLACGPQTRPQARPPAPSRRRLRGPSAMLQPKRLAQPPWYASDSEKFSESETRRGVCAGECERAAARVCCADGGAFRARARAAARVQVPLAPPAELLLAGLAAGAPAQILSLRTPARARSCRAPPAEPAAPRLALCETTSASFARSLIAPPRLRSGGTSGGAFRAPRRSACSPRSARSSRSARATASGPRSSARRAATSSASTPLTGATTSTRFPRRPPAPALPLSLPLSLSLSLSLPMPLPLPQPLPLPLPPAHSCCSSKPTPPAPARTGRARTGRDGCRALRGGAAGRARADRGAPRAGASAHVARLPRARGVRHGVPRGVRRRHARARRRMAGPCAHAHAHAHAHARARAHAHTHMRMHTHTHEHEHTRTRTRTRRGRGARVTVTSARRGDRGARMGATRPGSGSTGKASPRSSRRRCPAPAPRASDAGGGGGEGIHPRVACPTVGGTVGRTVGGGGVEEWLLCPQVESHFAEETVLRLPNWPLFSDCLMVWRRKSLEALMAQAEPVGGVAAGGDFLAAFFAGPVRPLRARARL